MRSGRLDRKIEFPAPTEEARARIMQIHARKMNVCPYVNYEELARYDQCLFLLKYRDVDNCYVCVGAQMTSTEPSVKWCVWRPP